MSGSSSNNGGMTNEQLQELVSEVDRLRTLMNGQTKQNEEMENLRKEVTTLRAAAAIVNTPIPTKESVRLNSPTPYDGTPGQLQPHLTQVRAYQRFNHMDSQADGKRIMHAASFLKGRALAWFEPYLTDFVNAEEFEKCKQETQEMFSKYENYENALRALFQDPDEERQAERELSKLRQKGPASAYAAEFRRICARVNSTHDTKIFMFYQGLKEDVKDELARHDRPDDFLQYVELAIKLDNRLYERRMERKGNTSGNFRQNNNKYKANTRKPYQKTAVHGQHAGPMELDAAQRNPTNKKDIKCYNCNKMGHYARECRSPKKNKDWKPAPEGSRQANVASRSNKTPPRSNKQRELAKRYCICNSAIYDQCQVHPENDPDDGRILFGINDDETPRRKRTEEEAHDSLHFTKCTKPTCPKHAAEKSRWAPVPENKRHEFTLARGETVQQRLSQLVQQELDQAEQANKHASLSWTACYDDNCVTHRSDKEGANWFPKNVAKQRTLAVGRREELPRDPRKELAGEVPQDLLAPRAQQEDPRAYLGKAPLLAPRTNITKVMIAGRPLEQVLRNPSHECKRPGDAGRTFPPHAQHHSISWASCVYDGCKQHLQDKAKHGWFPQRYQEQDIRQTYDRDDLKHWQVREHALAGYASFRLDPRLPLGCLRDLTGWRTCTNQECRVHMDDKVEEWHRLQQQKSQSITQRNIESIDKVLEQDGQPKNE
jgi:hypothetical protein